MTVVCTFSEFQNICKDPSNIKFGGIVLFVKDPLDGVTHASILNTSRLGVVFSLSNTPTKNNFLAEYPGAVQVDSITA